MRREQEKQTKKRNNAHVYRADMENKIEFGFGMQCVAIFLAVSICEPFDSVEFFNLFL